MAAQKNFKTLIIALSGDIAVDEDAMKWCLDGCYDVINRLKLKRPDTLTRFLAPSADITATTTSSAGVDITSIREIGMVTRNNIICRESSRIFMSKLTDTASIHFASVLDPAFIRQGTKLYIFPDCHADADKIGIYYAIPEYKFKGSTFATGETLIGTSTPDDDDLFPVDFYDHVIHYAAIQNLDRRLNDYLEDDEDVELINGAQSQLGIMRQRYELMFGGV